MSRLFLGLDSSTQSLSAMIVDYDSREVVYEASARFDEALSSYGTENGVLPNDDPLIKHSPPLMWVEALDVLFEQMCAEGAPLSEVLAVSGSGQQHGTVYLKAGADEVLGRLNPAEPLVGNLHGVFSRTTSPIWMDASTGAECAEIRDAVGGRRATTEETGSTTFERFSGPQIRRFFKTEPEAYADTAHVALVSSFLASILVGRLAPIDHGDGAGMNLMDIQKRTWSDKAVEATAPDLRAKLPELAASWTVIGPVSEYFVKRYGLNPQACALVWSGDNPNSVIGLGLVDETVAAISLGTSDTYFGILRACRTDPNGEGHVFGSPTGDYMSLICFKNGSLAREKVRDAYGLDWKGFSEALRGTPPGNNGAIMLPYFETEIVPRVLEPGVRRFNLAEDDAAANCRAVAEAQMMSMRIHSEWMGVRPDRLYATGGASIDTDLLQVMADVHGCPVSRFTVTNSAALGAALRAAHGWLRAEGKDPGWGAIVTGFCEPAGDSEIQPRSDAEAVYGPLMERYRACEKADTIS